MKYAIIVNNIVVNIAESESPLEDNWIEAQNAEIGWVYENEAFKEPPIDVEQLSAEARARRDELLRINIDSYPAIRWETLTSEQKDSLLKYRQDLLDVPQQQGFPLNINWPILPKV